MNLEERISALEVSLEASRFVITALLATSPDARKVSLFLSAFAQQFEENKNASPLLSPEQRKAVLDLLSKYEESAIHVGNAANQIMRD